MLARTSGNRSSHQSHVWRLFKDGMVHRGVSRPKPIRRIFSNFPKSSSLQAPGRQTCVGEMSRTLGDSRAGLGHAMELFVGDVIHNVGPVHGPGHCSGNLGVMGTGRDCFLASRDKPKPYFSRSITNSKRIIASGGVATCCFCDLTGAAPNPCLGLCTHAFQIISPVRASPCLYTNVQFTARHSGLRRRSARHTPFTRGGAFKFFSFLFPAVLRPVNRP